MASEQHCVFCPTQMLTLCQQPVPEPLAAVHAHTPFRDSQGVQSQGVINIMTYPRQAFLNRKSGAGRKLICVHLSHHFPVGDRNQRINFHVRRSFWSLNKISLEL
jgi:hypothetical protein